MVETGRVLRYILEKASFALEFIDRTMNVKCDSDKTSQK